MKIQEEGKRIPLSKLTANDEEKLRDLSLKTEEKYPGLSVLNAIETFLEVSGTDGAEVITEILCSNCGEPIGAIANGWPLCLFRKMKGYYCRHSSCEFYRKFIPVNKAGGLLSMVAFPLVHATLEDAGEFTDKDM